MLAIAVLVADDGLGAGLANQVANIQRLGAGERDRLLERNQLRAAIERGLDHRRAQIRQRAETKHVRLHGLRERGGVGAGLWPAEFGGGVIEAFLVNVADAGDLEFWIGLEGRGVVHAALAHADDEDGVLFHVRKFRD